MAARRALTLALPAGDPATARIWAYLEQLPAGADASAELRRLIVEALDAGARLARIEAKLDQALAGGLPAAAVVEPPPPPPTAAEIDVLLGSFDL